MYSPKIEEGQIRKLYLLKKSYAGIGIKKSMTEIVRHALNEYIPKAEKEITSADGAILKPDELG
jgi:hypothetical protein